MRRAGRMRPFVLTAAERERIARADELARAGAAGLDQLVGMLTDPSWSVRRHVVEQLAALGDVAVPSLVDTLIRARDDETRIAAAVDALAASTGAVEVAIDPMIRSDAPAVLADAAQILGRRRKTRSVPTLVALARHSDDNVAVAAIEALGRIGGRAAVDSLIEAVRSRTFFRTFPAIDVLGRTGDPRAIAPLRELIEDPQYVTEAARALAKTGDPTAAAPLLGLLSHTSDARVRVAAVGLAELNDRYVERVGESDGVKRVIREPGASPALARRMVRALPGASVAEQRAMCWVLGLLGGEVAIRELTLLLDAPTAVAEAATSALESLGAVAAEHVLAALRDGNSETRRVLLPAVVARLYTADGVLPCLDDPDPAVRLAACEALVRLADPGVVPKLFERIGDPDPSVAQAAIGAIQSLGSAETEHLALAAARSKDVRERRSALRILAYFGYSSALPIFLEAIEHDDARLRDLAVQGLAFVEGPEARDALVSMARHDDARARTAAMRALGQSNDDLRARSYLLNGLTDEDAWVRYYAAQSLGRLGFAAAAGPLTALLEDPAGQVRVAAVEALSYLDGPAARDALAATAQCKDPDVRRAALLGLGIQRRPESLPSLLAAAKSSDPATRLVAVSAIAGFSGSEVLDALAAAASDADASVRTAAIGFLGARATEEATSVLVGLTGASSILPHVLGALSRYSRGRVAGIVDALEAADDELAPLLTSALARMHHPESTRALLDVLTSSGTPARRAAATTMAAIGTPEMLEALGRAAENDPDPEVRRVCTASLAR